MSRYTTMLRYPVEQKLSELGLSLDESNWPKVYDFIGLGDYPIYDEAHRQVLNDKILRRYWFREIGFETFGQFRWHLRETMHSIMPYYNQLYESEGLVTDPMLSRSMDYSEKWTRDESTGRTSEGSGSSTSSNRNVFQDTPMNGLDTGAVEAMDYATNVTFDDGSGSSSTRSSADYTGDFDGTREHIEKGFDGSQSDLLLKYRQTLRNIDDEVVGELSTLFMGLW